MITHDHLESSRYGLRLFTLKQLRVSAVGDERRERLGGCLVGAEALDPRQTRDLEGRPALNLEKDALERPGDRTHGRRRQRRSHLFLP